MSITLEDRIGTVIAGYNKALEGFAGIKSNAEIDKTENYVLTKAEILKIHASLCERYGGDDTVRDMDLLDSLCVTPYQEVFGEVLYPTVYDKAAKFLETFVHYQLFADGNKRTGFMTMCVFLESNGIRFNMQPKEAYLFVMDVIQGKYPEIKDIAKIIKENSYVIEDFNLDEVGNMEKIKL